MPIAFKFRQGLFFILANCPPNPAFDPTDVNHFIARGARPKEPLRQQKPFDNQAMNSTANSNLAPEQVLPQSCLPAKKPRLAGLLQLLVQHICSNSLKCEFG